MGALSLVLLALLLAGAPRAEAQPRVPTVGGVPVAEPSPAEIEAEAQLLEWWSVEHDPPPLPQTGAERATERQEQVRAFYLYRDGRPAWIGTEGPRAEAVTLLAALREAGVHGLDPADYRPEGLEAAVAGAFAPGGDRHATEVAFTEAALHLADDLVRGQVAPDRVEGVAEVAGRRADVAAALVAALEDHHLREGFEALAPTHPDYAALRAELRLQREIAASAAEPEVQEAAAARARTVALNLERWRWLPDDTGDRRLVVDVAGQEAVLVARGEVVLRTRVVVGLPSWPTPLFSDAVERVVVHPSWYPPDTIEAAELIPKARQDPDNLSRQGFVAYVRGEPWDPTEVDWSDLRSADVRLVQGPGAGNALGDLKLELPNPHAVYLHDTPHKDLFARESRAFSHGCIRVEKPRELAAALLGWTVEDVDAAIAIPERRTFAVDPPVPVHLVYWTAAVDAEGAVVYREDLYGLDAALADVLAAAQSR